MSKRGQWEMDKMLARAVLEDRQMRRKVLGTFAVVMLSMFALGLWGIDEWLAKSVLRFGIYWLLCAMLCLFVMLFALFDLLKSISEEKGRQSD